MLHLLIAFLSGAITASIVFLALRKEVMKVGDELHISLDKFDNELIAAGKVANARISAVKELAEKAYGETGLSVIIHSKF